MTQRQMDHDTPLPPFRSAHKARHTLDARPQPAMVTS